MDIESQNYFIVATGLAAAGIGTIGLYGLTKFVVDGVKVALKGRHALEMMGAGDNPLKYRGTASEVRIEPCSGLFFGREKRKRLNHLTDEAERELDGRLGIVNK